YIISERMIPLKEVVKIAADEAGVPAPRRAISVPVLYVMGMLGSLRARLTGKDTELSMQSVRMMRAEAPVDHSKATRSFGAHHPHRLHTELGVLPSQPGSKAPE